MDVSPAKKSYFTCVNVWWKLLFHSTFFTFSCKNKPAFCKINNSKTGHCYLEKGQIHQRLSDQLQSEQQHEKGENPYRKRFCYTRNLKETGFKEKILCTDPHLQSCKRQKILFQMEFQKIRKNQIMSNARSASLDDVAWHFFINLPNWSEDSIFSV